MAKLIPERDNPSRMMFFCPGCKCGHVITVSLKPGEATWHWNGDVDAPTITPSILYQTGHNVPGHKQGESCWCTYNAEHPEKASAFTCGQCHSYVKEGNIEFLSDCTHELKNQTVPLPDWKV